MTGKASAGEGIAWRPTAEVVRRARIQEFIDRHGLDSFDALHRRSVEDPAWFTEALFDFLGIRFDPPYERVLDTSQGLPWTRWCVGGGLNISQACLRPGDEGLALIWEGEEGHRRRWTHAELARQVRGCAAAFRSLGLAAGDAVGIHLPMMPETVVTLLALAYVGAIAVPLFSGFGPAAIATRLQDVGARMLVTCNAYPRRGRMIAAKPVADAAVAECPTVTRVIVVKRTGDTVPMEPGRDVFWDDFLERAGTAGGDLEEIQRTGAEDPLIVLYTSGTTGKPKGILHSHCGFPVKAAQDMALGTDVGQGTRILWLTDIGWMMGPWLIYGATILGATMVLYDGAPDYPADDRLWELVERHRVEVLGVSPSLVRSQMQRGVNPGSGRDLSSLRIFGSTGEPWNPDSWWWLFREGGGGRVPIINYSGGTEVSGGILMGSPILPVKPCAFSAPCPGIAADVVDEHGRSVRGQVGELVIRKPWVGMARGFWNDPDRYLATYWSRWPGTWVHGDWALWEEGEEGQWFIHGRSDDTLKVAGKRVGPAEIESILLAHPAVSEAAVVGVPDELKGTVPVAVCVAAPGSASEELAEELRERVGRELGRPLRPRDVIFVRSLPRTRNAKVMRRVVRAACLGEDPGDVTSLENPDALEDILRAVGRARGA